MQNRHDSPRALSERAFDQRSSHREPVLFRGANRTGGDDLAIYVPPGNPIANPIEYRALISLRA
jgi:hypothetical protein